MHFHLDERGYVRTRLARGACLLIATMAIAPASPAPIDVPAQVTPESSVTESGPVFSSLRIAAPELNPVVLAMALEARDCAGRRGIAPGAQRLAVIDYSRPSTERRLWVFDLARPRLLFVEHVAHGRGSGDNLAHAFSNMDGSHKSSLGLFETAESYVGGNGYSLRMDGLEPGINDRARDRSIVMHGAWYVDSDLARRQGRLGRSYGCPAVRAEVAHPLIDTLKQGQLLFAYYPDTDWLAHSRLLGCKGPAADVSPRRTISSR